MKIAITGSIGSGKSSVGRYLVSKLYDVVDTDALVHAFYHSDNILYEPVLDVFGLDVLDESGEIDRSKLGERVFNDPLALNDLESIVFPAVSNYILNYDPEDRLVFFEVPMLFESGMDALFDCVLMVDCKREVALSRLELRGLTRDDALKRLNLQMDPEMKIDKSSYVIHNNGSIKELHEKIDLFIESRGNEQ